MYTHVDRFGRVIIPKPVRSHLGLRAGSALEVEELAQEIRLRPVSEEPALTRKEGVLVFTGRAAGDLREALRRHRDERLGHVTRRVR